MKKLLVFFICFFLCSSSSFSLIRYSTNPDACTEEGVCLVPKYAEDGRENYAIVSPVGYSDVKMISQSKRPTTLKGKTFALVGGSFMAHTTHNEIKKCIEKDSPQARYTCLMKSVRQDRIRCMVQPKR